MEIFLSIYYFIAYDVWHWVLMTKSKQQTAPTITKLVLNLTLKKLTAKEIDIGIYDVPTDIIEVYKKRYNRIPENVKPLKEILQHKEYIDSSLHIKVMISELVYLATVADAKNVVVDLPEAVEEQLGIALGKYDINVYSINTVQYIYGRIVSGKAAPMTYLDFIAIKKSKKDFDKYSERSNFNYDTEDFDIDLD